jgi:asparagine N-glycosylation enzyme membrane subunit Stt3
MAAILFGTFLRFNPTLLAGFPINQGGMFAVMVDDLRANHYLLPVYTTYNHLQIPFAYPPLGFYVGGLVADLFSMDSVQVVRWLPSFFASLSIPAFYLLARRLLKNKYYASVSTVFFAFMPRAFSWFITGSGLTRSPGQFFMLLTLVVVVRLYQENRRSDILWGGIFAGLTVMSHPEAAVHMVASVIFFWLILGHSRTTFIQLVSVGVIALIVTVRGG